MPKTISRKPKISKKLPGMVGQRAKISFGGGSPMSLIILEDRGSIGGRRFVRARWDHPDSDPTSTFEVPFDELIFSGPFKSVAAALNSAAEKAARPKMRPIVVGRRAKVDFGGTSPVRVVIVEDRGPAGARGRQIVRVRYDDPDCDPSSTFEVSADSLIFSGQSRAK